MPCKNSLPANPASLVALLPGQESASPHIVSIEPRVLRMLFLKLSYRDMEGRPRASEAVRKELELGRVPDPTTLRRSSAKVCKADWFGVNELLLCESGIAAGEEGVAADSTAPTLPHCAGENASYSFDAPQTVLL
ncbi:MAG: hypothetical protein RML93_04325 [Anaerolineales bacterium]|nr:hypothetical protein [Anaerolineales bacterium]MDW8446504.1 hypothetical protein [Anaerolineales bacterium]